MKILYASLTTVFTVASVISLAITVWVSKIFLTELVVSLETFLVLGVFYSFLVAISILTFSFYNSYKAVS